MKKIWVIAFKELTAYFKSPVAYIVLTVTVTVFNIFFFMIIEQNREATLRDVFKVMEFMFIFIVLILTMKVFAEEKFTGTMEFLMTSPTSNTVIVLGKYLGSVLFLTIILSVSLIYYFILEYFAHPDRLAILAGYLGIWLEGAFFMAVGVFMSSLTKNQIVAAMSSYIILFLCYLSISFIKYFSGLAQEVIRYASVWSHTERLFAGLIVTSDLIYFISGTLFLILLTRLNIENRLW